MKFAKLRFYQFLYAWALKRARKVYGNEQLYNKRPKLSDHALLRYIERVEGRNLDKLREQILTGEVYQTVKKYGGNGKFIVDGVRYTARDGMIVSIAPRKKNAPIIQGLDDNSDLPKKWSF